jgi:hypothetical protein
LEESAQSLYGLREMGKHKGSPTKQDLARAEAVFKQKTEHDQKLRSLRDMQDAEAATLREKIERLKSMRLAKEAADAQGSKTNRTPENKR